MMRKNYEQFVDILTDIEPVIAKKQIQGGHKVISPAERLVLTIRFLATGESFASLHFQFRIGKSTISYTVREVCHLSGDISKTWEKVSFNTKRRGQVERDCQ